MEWGQKWTTARVGGSDSGSEKNKDRDDRADSVGSQMGTRGRLM